MIFSIRGIFMVATVTLAAAFPATAQESDVTLLGTFGAWQAITDTAGGGLICLAVSVAVSSTGNKDGNRVVFVGHDPGTSLFGAATFATGVTEDNVLDVTLFIGTQEWRLEGISGNSAFSLDEDDQNEFVSAMKSGEEMRLDASNRSGVVFSDIYALTGATAAFNEIDRACGR